MANWSLRSPMPIATQGIGNGMSCNDARALREVLGEFDGVRCVDSVDIRKLAGIDVVHRRCVRAAKPFWPRSTSKHERRSRRPVWTGIESDLLRSCQRPD